MSFDTWWKLYPRKIAKGAARTEWQRLEKKGILPSLEVLTEAIEAQSIAYKTRPSFRSDGWQFFPHARTWLHQERWDDEIPVIVKKTHASPDAGKYEGIG